MKKASKMLVVSQRTMKRRGLCGRYLPFVAEVEMRELDFAYAVGVMLVPRLRTDQALVYILSL